METNFLSEFNSLKALVSFFKDNQMCKDYLSLKRWHGTPVCPSCGHKKTYLKKDRRYICAHCNATFSVLVGTVFQNTKIPLLKWFIAIYLICNNKQGLSSCQLAREIEVTQKTAWFILQKIRMLMKDHKDNFPDKVQGRLTVVPVEASTPIKIRLAEHPLVLHPRVLPFVKLNSRIFKDQYICYQSLAMSEKDEYNTEDPLHFFNIAEKQPSKNQSVYNGLWLQLKRMVMGVYHYLSAPLFHRYVFEALFRRKTFRDSNGKRFEKIIDSVGRVIPYIMVRPKD